MNRVAALRAARRPAKPTTLPTKTNNRGVDKPRVNKPRVDKPRVDKPHNTTPHDKPRDAKPPSNTNLDRVKRAVDKHTAKAPATPRVSQGNVPAHRRPGPTRPLQDRQIDRQDRQVNQEDRQVHRQDRQVHRQDRPVHHQDRPVNRQDHQIDREERESNQGEGDSEDDERRVNNHHECQCDKDEPTRPTLGSFKGREGKVVKLTALRAKPWIIACGTFSWRASDPGKAVPSIDAIVATCFARACRERSCRLALQTEHITCMKSLVTTYRTSVKEDVEFLVEKMLEFVDGDREHNRDMAHWLLPDKFHEAEPESKGERFPFQSAFLFAVVQRTLFGAGGLGLLNAARFVPIPVRFLAFLCSICNHVIYAYRHGAYNRNEHLQASVQELAFRGYLRVADDMKRNRRQALENLCAKMYDKARKRAGHDIIPEVERPRRRWAPDVEEVYVSKFVVPAEELDDLDGSDDAASVDSDDRVYRADNQEGRRNNPNAERSDSEDMDRDQSDDDDDNNGEGPSKPYGSRASVLSDAKGWPEQSEALEALEALEASEVSDASNNKLVPSDEEMDE